MKRNTHVFETIPKPKTEKVYVIFKDAGAMALKIPTIYAASTQPKDTREIRLDNPITQASIRKLHTLLQALEKQ